MYLFNFKNWDPYGLDTVLREQVAPTRDLTVCVRAPPLESGEVMGLVPTHLLEEVGALYGTTVVLTPPSAFSPQDPTDASENSLPDVWGELDAIDRLIFQMEAGNSGSILPPLVVRPLHTTAGAPPQEREMVFEPRLCGPVNQVGGVLPQGVPLRIIEERIKQWRRFFYTGREIIVHLGAPASDRDALSWLEEQITNMLNRLQDYGVSADDQVSLLLNSMDSTLNPLCVSFKRVDQIDAQSVLDNLELYCVKDVKMLRKACLKFKDMLMEKIKVDPFREACTIAGAAMLVYRRSHFKENTGDVQTAFLKQEIPPPSSSSGAVIGMGALSVILTGPPLSKTAATRPWRRVMVTIACVEKFKNAGYTVVEMWECTFNAMKPTNKDLKQCVLQHEVYSKEPLSPRDTFFGGRTNCIKLFHEADLSHGEKIEYLVHRMNLQQHVALLKTADKKLIYFVC
uniref:Uncharacterized protein n=1 Tax=Timema poppense TaxID=170557 RepID=A0A7R9CQ02_TIMPO|nr:unnamed protein product [Timema poppensis]